MLINSAETDHAANSFIANFFEKALPCNKFSLTPEWHLAMRANKFLASHADKCHKSNLPD